MSTPKGKWHYEEYDEDCWAVIDDTSKKEIAYTGDESIAQLLAAAPELVETLQELLDYTNQLEEIVYDRFGKDEDHATVARARAALKKAEGQD